MDAEDQVRQAVKRARELIDQRAYREAEDMLFGVIQDVESRCGDLAAELIIPLYRYAEAMSRQRPWNVFPPREREVLERALHIASATYGEESLQATRVRETLAASLSAAGKLEAAVQHMRTVVRVKERMHGEGIIVAHALNGLAEVLLTLEKPAEGAATYERAFRMAADRGDDVMDYTIRVGWGRALVLLERHAEAVPLLERALETSLRCFGERGKGTAWARTWLERARQGKDNRQVK
jgi:hypothetical protein